jgi:hypothetical protein
VVAEVTPDPGGGVRVRIERDEAELLRHLLTELQVLLEADVPREDPVVSRIFPDAFEEEEDRRAYRDMVDEDLRAQKLEAMRTVRDTLEGATLSDDQVDAWLVTLTDMRLAIGTRLGVDEETMAAEIDPDDPRNASMAVLHWLGFLQESIVQAASEQEG